MVASDAPGMLVLTDVVASEIRALVDHIRIERESPLIVEIPGPDGPMQGRKTLRQFVQEAVGIRVGEDEET
jgi:V/A-type H+-transporting ATPase subunit F